MHASKFIDAEQKKSPPLAIRTRSVRLAETGRLRRIATPVYAAQTLLPAGQTDRVTAVEAVLALVRERELAGPYADALALARASGLHPVAFQTPGTRARCHGDVCIYGAHMAPAWRDAFLLREVARRALRCVRVSETPALLAAAVQEISARVSTPAFWQRVARSRRLDQGLEPGPTAEVAPTTRDARRESSFRLRRQPASPAERS